MWQSLWPGVDVDEVPITHVTNGVHTASWLDPVLQTLYRRVLGDEWMSVSTILPRGNRLTSVPASELWSVHQERKQALINDVRRRIRAQRLRQGDGTAMVAAADQLLDPTALTIGFARRFATYKRATLIFRDLDRLRRLLNAPGRPDPDHLRGQSSSRR